MNDLVSKSTILRMMDDNSVVFRSEIENMSVYRCDPGGVAQRVNVIDRRRCR